MKTIAIYSRKSKFTGKGESIENQIELCRQYLERQYGDSSTFDILIYEDEGFSGKNTSRPQFKKMLQDARKKKFTVLICYRLDRISRNVGDFANLIEELSRLGIDFISIREAFDTSNPMGRAMMYIASVFAQLERETIAERIKDNMYELSKTGRWLGGTTPTGYRSVSAEKLTVEGKVRKAYQLELVPEEAQLIQTIFRKYLETGSLTKTDAYLVQNSYTTKKSNYFSRFSIRSILTNPVYMIADEDAYRYITKNEMDLYSNQKDFDGKHGIMAYNRTLQKEGTAQKIRDKTEWVIAVGKHEGIISGQSFVKVQEMLTWNRKKAYPASKSNSAILPGILYCSNCKRSMRAKLTARYDKNGDRIYDYLCTLKEKSGSGCCSQKSLNGNLADEAVGRMLTVFEQEDEVYYSRMGKLYLELIHQQKAAQSEPEHIRKTILSQEKEMKLLVSNLSRYSGSTAEPYLLVQIDELHSKLQSLKEQQKKIELVPLQNQLSEQEVNRLCDNLCDLSYCFRMADISQKRRAVRSLIHRAEWDGNSLNISLASSTPSCEDSK